MLLQLVMANRIFLSFLRHETPNDDARKLQPFKTVAKKCLKFISLFRRRTTIIAQWFKALQIFDIIFVIFNSKKNKMTTLGSNRIINFNIAHYSIKAIDQLMSKQRRFYIARQHRIRSTGMYCVSAPRGRPKADGR